MRSNLLLIIGVLALAGCPHGAEVQGRAASIESSSRSPAAAELTTTTFKVEGMHCEACSQAIEGKLAAIDGVSTVSADYVSGEAIVQYDARKVNPAQIIAAIESLKFKAGAKAPSS